MKLDLESTPATRLSSDGFSTIGSNIGYDEDLQLNIALKNSMKESFKKTTFTPDGHHISDLRAKRRLFLDSDKKVLHMKSQHYSSNKKAKQPSMQPSLQSPLDLTHDSPLPASAYAMSSKVRNRINNNGLDSAYFASTQYDDNINSPPAIQATIRLDAGWEQKIRIEIIRHMRVGKDSTMKAQARELYRVITRRSPSEKYSDVQSIASDCNNTGMTVTETVELMLAMV